MRILSILLLCLFLQSCATAMVTTAVVGTAKVAVKGTKGVAKLGYAGTKLAVKGTGAVVKGTVRVVRGKPRVSDDIASDYDALPDASD
ncbi:MAG: hypothetical protein AAF903_14665 [Pseudomonadota bacterium]